MKGILIFLTIFIPFVMNSKNYFKDGMEWRTLVWGTHEPVPTYGMETVTLEKSADNDMLKMYRYSDNDISDRKFVAFVRTDGDKVFFKVDESDTSEWYLMYDFGLKPGEGCYIYSPRVVSENKSPFVKMYLKCVNVLTDAGGWDIMTLEEYEDDSCQEIPGHNISVTWIKGLSSTRGVLWNNRFNSDGGSGLLKEVYDNGVLIYSNSTSEVKEIPDCSKPDISVDGLMISVSTDKEVHGSLYSQSGLHIGDYRFGKASVIMKVPDRGVYILKIGKVFRKIMIP